MIDFPLRQNIHAFPHKLAEIKALPYLKNGQNMVSKGKPPMKEDQYD